MALSLEAPSIIAYTTKTPTKAVVMLMNENPMTCKLISSSGTSISEENIKPDGFVSITVYEETKVYWTQNVNSGYNATSPTTTIKLAKPKPKLEDPRLGTMTTGGGYVNRVIYNDNDVAVTLYNYTSSMGTISANSSKSFRFNGTSGMTNTAEIHFEASGYEDSDAVSFNFVPSSATPTPKLDKPRYGSQTGSGTGYVECRIYNDNDVSVTMYWNSTNMGTISANSSKIFKFNGSSGMTTEVSIHFEASGYKDSDNTTFNFVAPSPTPDPKLEEPRLGTMTTGVGYVNRQIYNDNDVKVKLYNYTTYLGDISANSSSTFRFNGTSGTTNTAEIHFEASGYRDSDDVSFNFVPSSPTPDPQLDAGTATVQEVKNGFCTIRFTNPNDVSVTLYINGSSKGTIRANSYIDVDVAGTNSQTNYAEYYLDTTGYRPCETQTVAYVPTALGPQLSAPTATLVDSYNGYCTFTITNNNDVEVKLYNYTTLMGTIPANSSKNFDFNGTNGMTNTAKIHFEASNHPNSADYTFNYVPTSPPTLTAGNATVQANFDGYSVIRFTNPNAVDVNLFVNGVNRGTIKANSYLDVNVNGTNSTTNTASYYLSANGYSSSTTKEVNFVPSPPKLEKPSSRLISSHNGYCLIEITNPNDVTVNLFNYETNMGTIDANSKKEFKFNGSNGFTNTAVVYFTASGYRNSDEYSFNFVPSTPIVPQLIAPRLGSLTSQGSGYIEREIFNDNDVEVDLYNGTANLGKIQPNSSAIFRFNGTSSTTNTAVIHFEAPEYSRSDDVSFNFVPPSAVSFNAPILTTTSTSSSYLYVYTENTNGFGVDLEWTEKYGVMEDYYHGSDTLTSKENKLTNTASNPYDFNIIVEHTATFTYLGETKSSSITFTLPNNTGGLKKPVLGFSSIGSATTTQLLTITNPNNVSKKIKWSYKDYNGDLKTNSLNINAGGSTNFGLSYPGTGTFTYVVTATILRDDGTEDLNLSTTINVPVQGTNQEDTPTIEPTLKAPRYPAIKDVSINSYQLVLNNENNEDLLFAEISWSNSSVDEFEVAGGLNTFDKSLTGVPGASVYFSRESEYAGILDDVSIRSSTGWVEQDDNIWTIRLTNNSDKDLDITDRSFTGTVYGDDAADLFLGTPGINIPVGETKVIFQKEIFNPDSDNSYDLVLTLIIDGQTYKQRYTSFKKTSDTVDAPYIKQLSIEKLESQILDTAKFKLINNSPSTVQTRLQYKVGEDGELFSKDVSAGGSWEITVNKPQDANNIVLYARALYNYVVYDWIQEEVYFEGEKQLNITFSDAEKVDNKFVKKVTIESITPYDGIINFRYKLGDDEYIEWTKTGATSNKIEFTVENPAKYKQTLIVQAYKESAEKQEQAETTILGTDWSKTYNVIGEAELNYSQSGTIYNAFISGTIDVEVTDSEDVENTIYVSFTKNEEDLPKDNSVLGLAKGSVIFEDEIIEKTSNSSNGFAGGNFSVDGGEIYVYSEGKRFIGSFDYTTINNELIPPEISSTVSGKNSRIWKIKNPNNKTLTLYYRNSWNSDFSDTNYQQTQLGADSEQTIDVVNLQLNDRTNYIEAYFTDGEKNTIKVKQSMSVNGVAEDTIPPSIKIIANRNIANITFTNLNSVSKDIYYRYKFAYEDNWSSWIPIRSVIANGNASINISNNSDSSSVIYVEAYIDRETLITKAQETIDGLTQVAGSITIEIYYDNVLNGVRNVPCNIGDTIRTLDYVEDLVGLKFVRIVPTGEFTYDGSQKIQIYYEIVDNFNDDIDTNLVKTRRITPDDFKALYGIDLDLRLKGYDNVSRKADIFLAKIEMDCEAYLQGNYYRKINFERMTPFQKRNFKLGLLAQAYYVFRNGDLSSDSGYDPEKGIIAPRGKIEDITISSTALNYFKICNLLTRHIKGGGFFHDWWL